jgi:signal transduction histidine kinase
MRVKARTAQLSAANEVLEREIAERKRLEKEKDDFLAMASHELRTPLTAIKGYAALALRAVRSMDDARLIRALDIVSDKTDQISRLIDEMLDVRRIEQNALSLTCEYLDMVEMARQVVERLELLEQDCVLHVDTPPDQAPVYADRLRIEQVLTNLIENGIKYTPNTSSDERRIDISITQQDGEIITAVRDYGVGIPREQLPQVFNRFFRASNISSAGYPGMGLGLYIAHGIVERHGGRMWVDSVEQRGSTFSFALPLAIGAGEDSAEAPAARQA